MEILLGPRPLVPNLIVFAVAAALTLVGAVRMAGLGDVHADRTGWGEAIFGALFFCAAPSLSGIVITAVSMVSDSLSLAFGNAVDGIAAQTVAIAVDMFYRRGSLEHARPAAGSGRSSP